MGEYVGVCCGVIADIFGGKCFLKEVRWVEEEGVADCGADADADQVDGTGCYEAQGGISGESVAMAEKHSVD